jgi:hypothetical protein
MLPTQKITTFVGLLSSDCCIFARGGKRERHDLPRERERQKKRTILIEKNRKNKTFPIEYVRLP